MTFAMKQIAGGVLAMAMAVSGGMAMAKAHSQNNTATPGDMVQAETVAAAYTLGVTRSGGKAVGPL